MVAAALVTLLAASEPPKVAVLSFSCSGRRLEQALCDAWMERLVAGLAATGVRVVTQKDLADALSVERQRQLTGCAEDESSCSLDLAQALAVDGILSATVVQPLEGFIFSLKVTRPSDGSRLLGASRTVSTERDMLGVLDDEAARIGRRLSGGTSTGRALTIAAAAAGGAAVIAGAVLFGLSKADAARLKSTEPLPSDAVAATASRGSALQTAGLTLIGVGIPVALAFGLWAALGFDRAQSVALWLTPGGAAVAWGASW